MKKKEYMIPQSQIVMLQSRASLLNVSGTGDNRGVTASEEEYSGNADGSDGF